jgi:hypothetical protein
MINSIPELSLADSDTVPQLGFGVFQVPPRDTADLVDAALETGNRSIDTARACRNAATRPGQPSNSRSSASATSTSNPGHRFFRTTGQRESIQGRPMADATSNGPQAYR